MFGRILGPTKFPMQWVRSSFLGLKFQGQGAERLPFLQSRSSQTIELYTGSAKKMYTHFNERKLYVV